jgi:hypothetical protein
MIVAWHEGAWEIGLFHPGKQFYFSGTPSNSGRSTSSSQEREYDKDYRDYEQHVSDPRCFSSNATGAKGFGYQGNY